MKFILGIDIDGTICEWPEKIDPGRMPDVLDLEPYQDSVKTLHMLRNDGVEVVYITFREDQRNNPNANAKEKTHRWLSKFMFPNPDRVHFGDEFTFKHEILKKLGAFGIVEDDYLVCERAEKHGFHTFLHTKPWYNSEYIDVEEDLFHTFYSWDELGNMILEIKQKIK